jgi:hypothetical protein
MKRIQVVTGVHAGATGTLVSLGGDVCVVRLSGWPFAQTVLPATSVVKYVKPKAQLEPAPF